MRPREGGQGTAAVYADLIGVLEEAAEKRGDRHTIQVGVDIVAGTSAGGINGICLARALDGNYSQEAIRDFWITEADIRKLLNPAVAPFVGDASAEGDDLRGVVPPLDGFLGPPPENASGGFPGVRVVRRALAVGKLAWPAVRLVRKRPQSVLDGDRMCFLTWDALTGMEKLDGRPPAELLSDGLGIELAVTATEYAGHQDAVPLSHELVFDETHRHVFHLRGRGGGSLDEDVAMLAFAARSTASFPGAFAPVNFAHFQEQVVEHGRKHGPAPQWERIAETYLQRGPADGAAAKRRFVDGGVLDNMPFDATIAAIRRRTAPVQVRRSLVYVEPSPTPPPREDPLGLPDLQVGEGNILSATFRSVSTIPLSQTMGDQIASVRRRNTEVAELQSVIEQSFDGVRTKVGAIAEAAGSPNALSDPSAPFDAAWWTSVSKCVHASDDLTPTYTRVKVSQVVNGLAALVADVCGYGDDSLERELIGAAIRRGAVAQRLLPRVGVDAVPTESLSKEQLDFLQGFDVEYERRRIAFIRDGLGWLYPGVKDAPGFSRAQVGAVKQIIAMRAEALETGWDAVVADPHTRAAALAVFSAEHLKPLLPPTTAGTSWDLDAALDEFVAAHKVALTELEGRAKATLAPVMKDFGRETFKLLLPALKTWTAGPERAIRYDLLVRYVGFPIWDAITFPISIQHGVTERDDQIEIRRMSPFETFAVVPPEGKQKLYGVGVHHFGAFFDEQYRQNDYLWGRLDGCCQLVDLLVRRLLPAAEARAFDATPFMHDACKAALAQEWQRLGKVRDLAEDLWHQVTKDPVPR